MKVLIVDNQPQVRDSLTRLCRRGDDLHVVGEAKCGRVALDAVGQLKPDVMLVDVELPDMSGFDLLRPTEVDTHPKGIMVAKCADHAATAFAEGAIDYLVTPVTAERFDLAIARARRQCNRALPDPDISSPTMITPRFVVGERQRRLYPLDPRTIDYIEADGNYVTLRAGKTEYLSRDSLKRLSMQLAEIGFVRIERSLLVNSDAVSYLEVAGNGTYSLTLRSGVCLHSSTAYRDLILRVIPLPKRYRGTAS